MPPEITGRLRLPDLPADMVEKARKRNLRRALARRAVVLGVRILAIMTIAVAWYFAGARETREHYEGRIETLVAERDYYHRTVNSVHDTWEGRDLCEAEMRAAGKDPEVLGIFSTPELQSCYAEQEARVAELNARGAGE